MQRCFREDIDLPSQQVFQVLFEGNAVHQTPSPFHLREHVQVAVDRVVAPGRRPEDAHVAGAVLSGKSQDLLSMIPKASAHGKERALRRMPERTGRFGGVGASP